jgi:hypothetical protein
VIPLAFVVALAAATLVVLVVAAVALARGLKGLSATLVRFHEETRPYLEQIERDAQRAAERMERLGAPDSRRGASGGEPVAEQASHLRPER